MRHMGNDDEQRVADGDIDENHIGDWCVNVVAEIDPPVDQAPSTAAIVEDNQRPVVEMQSGTMYRSSPKRGLNESADHRFGARTRQIGSQAINSYQRLPSWALLPQIFLAAGWGRAGVAHALSRRWWNGEEILEFVALDTGLQVGVYRYVLTWIVEPFPVVTAAAVGVAELVIAILLAVNYRVKVALALGAFLNVQFMLAGVVNPSIFYLVASLGIAIWRLETTASPATISRLTRISLGFGLAAAAFLAPSVRTIEPETAIEDPALVLIFLIALSAASLWWVSHRTALANDTLAALIGGDSVAGQTRRTSVSAAWLSVAVAAAVAILIAGFVMFAEDDAREGEAGASLDSAEFGSLGRPYAFGQAVTLSYNDVDTGILREWQVQVTDALLEDGNRIGLASPTGRARLAMVRIQLRYPGWEGRTVDLKFNALDQSGHPFPASREGCGERVPLLPQAFELATSGEIEGWVCWWVPATDLRSLFLGVEAEAADGLVYMSLSRD